MIDEWTTDGDETLLLLQEEIERLEYELRLRDEAMVESFQDGEATVHIVPDSLHLERKIDELSADLASRDESIALLLEQVRLFEEAESASRAEWEQLNNWVSEVERRVERRDPAAQELQLELETARNQLEAQRRAIEKDRALWEAQREVYEDEAQRHRDELAKLAARPDGGPDAAYQALETENRRLRETCHTLVRGSAEAADANRLRSQLAATQAQLDELRREHGQAVDEHKRERLEAENTIASLRNQLAVASLKPAEEPSRPAPAAAPAPVDATATLSVDERIRALRQHLIEIHDREREERDRNKLSSRLSRLWRHTGPVL